MNKISIKIWLPVIVIILVVFGIVVYSNWPKEEVKIPEIEIPKKETFEIPADWKTYRNEEIGVEFNYPSTAEIIDQSFFQNPSDFQIDIHYDSRSGFEPPRLIVSNQPDSRGDQIKTHDINKFLMDNFQSGENNIHFELNSEDVHTNCIYYGENPNFKLLILDFCNQILSTFKFIE